MLSAFLIVSFGAHCLCWLETLGAGHKSFIQKQRTERNTLSGAWKGKWETLEPTKSTKPSQNLEALLGCFHSHFVLRTSMTESVRTIHGIRTYLVHNLEELLSTPSPPAPTGDKCTFMRVRLCVMIPVGLTRRSSWTKKRWHLLFLVFRTRISQTAWTRVRRHTQTFLGFKHKGFPLLRLLSWELCSQSSMGQVWQKWRTDLSP